MPYTSVEETLNFDLKLEETTIAWIAGLLEGEAAFHVDKRIRDKTAGTPPSPTLNLRISDEDVVWKFGNYVKKKVHPIKQTDKQIKEGNKQIYSCFIGDRATCYYLFNKILPYMGERRSAEIKKGLELIEHWATWVNEGGRSRSQFNMRKDS